jgi:tetratricopeptide (TPR) repeat protein
MIRNGDLGRSMLPQLGYALEQLDTMLINEKTLARISTHLASTLISSSRFSDNLWKTACLTRAKDILRQAPFGVENARLAYRESCILRMAGDLPGSEKALAAFSELAALVAHDGDAQNYPRYNAVHGEIIISHSENLVREWQLEDAKRELSKWCTLQHSCESTMEKITALERDTIMGKILKYQGHFDEALLLLEPLLEDDSLPFKGSGWYCVLLSNVADLHCELGRPGRAERLLKEQLEIMIDRKMDDISSGRRLRLSLIESFLARRMYEDAEKISLGLTKTYAKIRRMDYATAVNRFRVLIGLARVHHMQGQWEQALEWWRQAENMQIARNSTLGILQLSMSYVLLKLGLHKDSHAMSSHALRLIGGEVRTFWIVGFHSFWRESTITALQEECGDFRLRLSKLS